jgi:parallel beta-helix repeat protein
LGVASRIKKAILLLAVTAFMTACGGGGGTGDGMSGNDPAPGGGDPSPPVDAGIVGKTFYVATNGNDANPGTLAAPFRSINHAKDMVAPGDTIEVRTGTYPGAWIKPPANPVVNGWIRLKPYNGEKVTITALGNPGSDYGALVFYDPACDITQYDKLDASDNPIPDGCKTRDMYWSVEGLTLIGHEGHGNVVKIDTPHVRLVNNDLSGSWSEIVKLVRSADDIEIRGNVIHRNINSSAMGIDIVGADRTLVIGNTLYDIRNVAIFAKGNSRNTVIDGNTVKNSDNRGIMLGNLTGKAFMKDGHYETYDGVIRNNIVDNTWGPCLGAASSFNAKILNNQCHNAATNSQAAIFISKESQWDQGNTNVEIKNNLIVASSPYNYAVKVATGGMSDNRTLHIDNNTYWSTDGAGRVFFIWEGLPNVNVFGWNYDQWRKSTDDGGVPQDMNSKVAKPG